MGMADPGQNSLSRKEWLSSKGQLSMFLTTQEERRWFVQNLALGLISHLEILHPPVPVEEILRNPPTIFVNPPTHLLGTYNTWEETLKRPIYIGGRVIIPGDLPEDERRYAIAQGIMLAIGESDHGKNMGLSQLLSPYLWELKDYFARILLAPDPLIVTYRQSGGRFDDFAKSFFIPPRIAVIRWEEPAYIEISADSTLAS
jgi:hypothetical protein